MAHEHDTDGAYAHCQRCGTPVIKRQVSGRARETCPVCGFIHYQNPSVAAVAVALDGDRVLLVRRDEGLAGAGQWSLPGGFIEWDEDIRAAAARELFEETGLQTAIRHVLDVRSSFEDPAKPTVVVWFAADVTGGTLTPGDDAVDAAWFPFSGLPPLAFRGDGDVLSRIADGSLTYPRPHDDTD